LSPYLRNKTSLGGDLNLRYKGMKMKNKALKIWLSGLALAVAGLVNAATTTVIVESRPDTTLHGADDSFFMYTGIQVAKGELINISVNESELVRWEQPYSKSNANGDTTEGILGTPFVKPGKSELAYLVPGTVRYSLVGLISAEVDLFGDPVPDPVVSATSPGSEGTLVTEGTPDAGWGFIGADYSQIAHASGYLYLAFNDDRYRDNRGYWTVNITTSVPTAAPSPLISCAAVSGGYINIAADSSVNGCLAAKEAVNIGAHTSGHNIYAGAAVTTGDSSTAENVFSGAATSVGANAKTKNVHAGAAVTLGAHSEVGNIYAGAAITTGVGASTDGDLAEDANTTSTAPEDIHNAMSMDAAIAQINATRADLTNLIPDNVLFTTMGTRDLTPGVWEGGALNITAASTITFDADEGSDGKDHVWVINLGTLTVGGVTHFEIKGLGENDTASIIWNVKTVITLGAGTSFRGTAFVGGAFSADTSTVSCGNLYAIGYIGIGSIGVDRYGDVAECENQNPDVVFRYLETLK
jgi:hypothetical protein